ncbi:carbamate kinase [Streptomyces sp. MUM 136J]|uniref:amino acid kinase family protein n=1 Tax=Streptomyces sp. MUM 136J TaxID=2791992 RepID=UPI001F041480|nr:carbamate kinase [Streptomyces sp. MUM 136J]MCH0571046.1 carbamate kinase [Streptomyces sp. MUM 136J]
MRIVIALGNNALLRRGQRPDAGLQRANVVRVATAIAPLAHEHDLVITHGGEPRPGGPAGHGPSAGARVDPFVAQAQGRIGSLLVCAFHDVLPGRRVAAVLTHTLVRADDPAFTRPAAPGGRHAVPAPGPERILETDTVRALLDSGTVTVCAGDGGVPVLTDRTGALRSVPAVVDKDLAAALLAEDLKADFLLLLTDVPNLYADRGTGRQRAVLDATPAELRRGQYPPDTMGPKVEAAARFVERTGGLAAIGHLDAAHEIVHGLSGTLVRPALPGA